MLKSKPATPALQPVRTAAIVREELAMAKESLSPLSDKLTVSQAELATAQQAYDTAVQAYALGQSHTEPDRGELAAAVSKSDALRRISLQQEHAVQQLTAELAQAELSEAITAGRERLTPLRALAEAKLEEFSTALATAKAAEKELFNLLFDEGSGLRQRFPSPELQREATSTRHFLRDRVEEVAREFRFAIDSRFETDGEVNLGDTADYIVRHLLRR